MSAQRFSAVVLVVDDDQISRELLSEVLTREGYGVQLAQSGEEALQYLSQNEYPVILSDIRMLQVDGLAVLKEAKRRHPASAVLLMTGFGSMEGAVEAIQQGAFDYVSKPFQIRDIKTAVARGIKHWEGMSQTAQGKPRLPIETPPTRGMIGKSPQMVDVYKTVARASLSSSTVLILGESGTGKELVARAVHAHSPRAERGKFVAVNCGALTETLLESELFGHVRGAFTGATIDKRGLFEEADGGTLFLDEVGDLSPALQVKLLRVLQEGEVRPVGSQISRQVDVRVIAATHRDLEMLARNGKFREDLLYRLRVIAITLPVLRERKEDIRELVEYFLAKYSRKNGKSISHVDPEALDALEAYSWPGNVRELEHALERAVALAQSPILYLEDFPSEIRTAQKSVHTGPMSSEDLEREQILQVLREQDYNKSRTSEVLGIDRATLYRRAGRLGIDLASGAKRDA